MEVFSLLEWKKSELVFVVTVMLLVWGVSWAQLKTGEMKTRDAQRKADVELVARALGAYYLDYKVYPPAVDGKILSCGGRGAYVCEWGEGKMVDGDNVTYLGKMPIDPLSGAGRTYVYEVATDRKSFGIYVGLEDRRNEAFKKDLTQECGNNVQCSWYVRN